MRFYKFFRFFENLLFPPRCVSCRDFLQKDLLDPCESPLCSRCRTHWEREKGEVCPDCGLEFSMCQCIPSRLKSVGVEKLIYLFSYSSSKNTVGRQTVLNMKKRANATAVSFLSEQLFYPVSDYMMTHGLSVEQIGFCYVPRGRANLLKYGFDQSKALCEALAKRSETEAYSLFVRHRGRETEQKKLSAKERAENTRNRFAVDKRQLARLPEPISCLFLVDDIVTSGESMRGCVKELREHFKGDIVALSVARTVKKKQSREFL